MNASCMPWMNMSVDERGGEPAVVDHRVSLSELKVRGDGHASALMSELATTWSKKLSCVMGVGARSQVHPR